MEELNIKYNEKNSEFEIKNHLKSIISNNNNIVILCIGTDKCIYDCLAPLIGTFLEKSVPVPVFGTLKSTVHALNLAETINKINKKYSNPFIIAIDACLGVESNIGRVIIKDKPLKPGACVGKNLGEVGNISIIGIVDINSELFYKCTRLYEVFEMAKIISNGIIGGFSQQPITSVI